MTLRPSQASRTDCHRRPRPTRPTTDLACAQCVRLRSVTAARWWPERRTERFLLTSCCRCGERRTSGLGGSGRGASGLGATHSDPIVYPAQDGTGSGDECVSARHTFGPGRRMCVGSPHIRTRLCIPRRTAQVRGPNAWRRKSPPATRRPRRHDAVGAKVPRSSQRTSR